MTKKIFILFLFVGAAYLLNACYYDKEQLLTPPKSTGATCLTYSFATQVNPIIQASCNNGVGCHGAGSSNGPGAFTTYAQIQAAAAQIQSSVTAGRMPLGSSLSGTQLLTINCWISNGALNN
jgi:hypothetical protein